MFQKSIRFPLYLIKFFGGERRLCTVDDTVVIVVDVKGNGCAGVLSVLSAAESIATIVRLYTHYDDESEIINCNCEPYLAR